MNYEIPKTGKTNHRLRHVCFILAAVILVLAVVCTIYVNQYYHSDNIAMQYLEGTDEVKVRKISSGLFLDGSGEDYAMIFYPGAKVEYTAYLPMLMQMAEQGIDCFLVKMPGNLAFLGSDKAEGIMKDYEYDHWYMSGHSLGGAMAASYAARHLEELDGLVLFAAYPTDSLVRDGFQVISVYGSEDRVLNQVKMEEGLKWMPADYTEVCIQGGNHAQFGSYGVQQGDGQAQITPQEQWKQTVQAVMTGIGYHILMEK